MAILNLVNTFLYSNLSLRLSIFLYLKIENSVIILSYNYIFFIYFLPSLVSHEDIIFWIFFLVLCI